MDPLLPFDKVCDDIIYPEVDSDHDRKGLDSERVE